MSENRHIPSADKHIPMRQCVGCRGRSPKSTLLRVTLVDGRPVIDPPMRRPGRGAYVHSELACVDRAVRRGGFFRALRTSSNPSHATELRRDAAAWIATERLLDKQSPQAKDQ